MATKKKAMTKSEAKAPAGSERLGAASRSSMTIVAGAGAEVPRKGSVGRRHYDRAIEHTRHCQDRA
jgi:hypothetical protein